MKVVAIVFIPLFMVAAFFTFLKVKNIDGSDSRKTEGEVVDRRQRGAGRLPKDNGNGIVDTVVDGKARLAQLATEDEFSSIWDQFEDGFENRSERYFLLTSLISKMSSLGMTSEAIELIKEKSGPGNFQSSLIGAAFAAAHVRSADEYQDLLEKCGLTMAENRTAALMGIAGTLGRENLRASEVASFGVLCEGESSAFFSSLLSVRLHAHLRGKGSEETVLNGVVGVILELQKEALIDISAVDNLLVEAPLSPFSKVTALRGLGRSVDDFGKPRDLALSMVRESPEKTLSLLSDANNSVMVDAAMGFWLREDPFGAQDWINRQRRQVSEDFYQDLVPSFVKLSIEKRDYEAGRRWVAEVTDDVIREQLLEKILEAEKNAK